MLYEMSLCQHMKLYQMKQERYFLGLRNPKKLQILKGFAQFCYNISSSHNLLFLISASAPPLCSTFQKGKQARQREVPKKSNKWIFSILFAKKGGKKTEFLVYTLCVTFKRIQVKNRRVAFLGFACQTHPVIKDDDMTQEIVAIYVFSKGGALP